MSDALDSDLDPATVSVGRIRFGAYYRDPSPSDRFLFERRADQRHAGRSCELQSGGLAARLGLPDLPSRQSAARPERRVPATQRCVRPTAARAASSSRCGRAPRRPMARRSPTWRRSPSTTVQQTTTTVSNTVSIPASLASHVTTVVPNAGALKPHGELDGRLAQRGGTTRCAWPRTVVPYRDWRNGTTVTTDTLGASSDHHPHTYTFYSVARDPVGNSESIPTGPDVTIASQVAVDSAAPWTLALEGRGPTRAGRVHPRAVHAGERRGRDARADRHRGPASHAARGRLTGARATRGGARSFAAPLGPLLPAPGSRRPPAPVEGSDHEVGALPESQRL